MASATWGRNMAPYWLLDSPYSLVSVNMVLAAGNVTRTMPCTSPAALMTARSVVEAIWPSRQLQPSGQSAGSYRPVPQSARPDGCCHPPSQDEAALRDGYRRILTARAITSPKMTSEPAACRVMAALAQRASGITSVGLNAVALVKPR